VSNGLQAQFADDTANLFSPPADAPKAKDDVVIYQFSTAPDAEPVETENSGAQSVEEICCAMPEDERANEGLCVDVQCPE
jgi:hypothetical protein